MNVVYISYDGMLEPLGQSQVLTYLEALAKDRSIHLLSFEKPLDWSDAENVERVRRRIDAAGMHCHACRYHKQPSSLATALDIGIGTLVALGLVLRNRIGIGQARSYVAGVMAWLATSVTTAKFMFDMRGFWADERVDGGLWPRGGRMFRVAKWFERKLLLSADHVVSLSWAAVREIEKVEYLQGGVPPMTVIPTCADLSRFVPRAPPREGFVLGHVGSAGTWYLFDAAVACFARVRELKPDARWLIINRNEHGYILERILAGGESMDAVELRGADHSEVPAQMARMHDGVFFIKPVFSKQASAPTKLGEFLGCGIPCLGNSGVGDMAEILEGARVGVALNEFDDYSLRHGLERLIELTEQPDIQARCVAAAHRHFSLDEGVARYEAVYRSLDPA